MADIDELIKNFSNEVDRIDQTTKKISEATSRIKFQMTKTRGISDRPKISVEKYKQVEKFTQCVLDACTNFHFMDEANGTESGGGGDEKDGANSSNDAASFERFTSVVETQLDRCEKEIVKLNTLDEITKNITNRSQ